MPKLTLYRQARVDGGIRTEVEINGVTCWGLFAEGEGDPDPALLWYVDVRCEGEDLPTEPATARDWLLKQAPTMRQALAAVAEELSVGVDHDLWPLRREIAGLPTGVSGQIVVSAIRRLTERQISAAISDMSAHWTEFVTGLQPLLPVP